MRKYHYFRFIEIWDSYNNTTAYDHNNQPATILNEEDEMISPLSNTNSNKLLDVDTAITATTPFKF